VNILDLIARVAVAWLVLSIAVAALYVLISCHWRQPYERTDDEASYDYSRVKTHEYLER
jgi:hypothetical protein